MENMIEMFCCDGYQNLHNNGRKALLVITTEQIPANHSYSVLQFTQARNVELRELLTGVMAAAEIDTLRYRVDDGKVEIAYR